MTEEFETEEGYDLICIFKSALALCEEWAGGGVHEGGKNGTRKAARQARNAGLELAPGTEPQWAPRYSR